VAAAKPKTFVSPLGASERILSGGRVAEPGVPVELDAEAMKDEHNKRLIASGQLVEVKTKTTEGGE
jgi:hypothetical protein